MKQLQERSFKSRVPLYDYAVVELVLTSNMRASEKKRELKYAAQAHTLGSNNTITVLIKDRAPLNHVAHEGVHVASHILYTAGVRAGLSNDEPIAYLVDWFTKWALRCTTKAARKAELTLSDTTPNAYHDESGS